ncbi:hypothetical protein GS399_03720, partial [Pedobacter sp. HMF7647]
GVSGGFLTGTLDENAVNSLTTAFQFKADQLHQVKSNPFNGYFLAGPSVRFGKRVEVTASVQGGMFLNNPGSMTIGLRGVERSFYSYSGSGSNLYPGFSGSVSIAYPVTTSTRFFIGTDYLQSKSTINSYDPQNGQNIATMQTKDLKLVSVSLGISKSFGSKNTKDSEENLRKKHIGNVKYEDFAVIADPTTGQEITVPLQAHAINTKGTGATANGRKKNENCGAVTIKSKNPDGSSQETTFACPDDALTYTSKRGIIHKDLAARNIISGRLSWANNSNNSGIITNKTPASSNFNSVNRTPDSGFGDHVRIAVRESANGNGRELKKYGLIFADQGSQRYKANGPSIQENPLYSQKGSNPLYHGSGSTGSNPLYEGKMQSVKNNPLYQGSGSSASNPMHENKTQPISDNPLYEGVADISVSLVDLESGAEITNTQTEASGDFFFANVPDGRYAVKLNGAVGGKKGYDYYASTRTDLVGIVDQSDEQLSLMLSTREMSDENLRIVKTKSNVKNNRMAAGDLDPNASNDPVFKSVDPLKIKTKSNIKNDRLAENTGDQNTPDESNLRSDDPLKIKTKSNIKNDRLAGNTGDQNTPDESNLRSDDPLKIKTKSNIKNDRLAAGTTQDTPDGYSLRSDDPLKIKTKSNIKNDRLASGNSTGIGSFFKLLTIQSNDLDGDGIPETIAGGPATDAALRPGQPIGGIVVKGGRNPGGSLRTVTTNESGVFELNGLDAGNYIITLERNILIDDETVVVLDRNDE